MITWNIYKDTNLVAHMEMLFCDSLEKVYSLSKVYSLNPLDVEEPL